MKEWTKKQLTDLLEISFWIVVGIAIGYFLF